MQASNAPNASPELYINFWRGDMRDARELSILDDGLYGIDDIEGLVESMIIGCTGSARLEGAKAALADESLWVDLAAMYGDDAVQEALEELHAVINDFDH